MDMNKVFFQRKEDAFHRWHVVDAKGKILGRLATEIAELLMGKGKVVFARQSDVGDYVVVTNAKDIVLSGDKLQNKIYTRVSGWMGGKKEMTAGQMMQKDSTEVIHLAVQRMLPKNTLSRGSMRRLKVYAGAAHPHKAQIETVKI
jgi:large subunit ribosomal protein L13